MRKLVQILLNGRQVSGKNFVDFLPTGQPGGDLTDPLAREAGGFQRACRQGGHLAGKVVSLQRTDQQGANAVAVQVNGHQHSGENFCQVQCTGRHSVACIHNIMLWILALIK
jgi:hypothetical protein